jgi:hypothetical protein
MSAPSLALVSVIGNENSLDVAKCSRTNQEVGFEDARAVGDFRSFVIERMNASTGFRVNESYQAIRCTN